MCSIPPPLGNRSQKQPPGDMLRLSPSDFLPYVCSGSHHPAILPKEAQAISGGTTRFTVSRTSKPFGEALTTLAVAGIEATRAANPTRYFIVPSHVGRMAPLGRSVQNGIDLCGDLIDGRHAVDPPHQ